MFLFGFVCLVFKKAMRIRRKSTEEVVVCDRLVYVKGVAEREREGKDGRERTKKTKSKEIRLTMVDDEGENRRMEAQRNKKRGNP